MIEAQTIEQIQKLLPPRPIDSHKGKNGHALLCAGSDTYIGAALLCAKAALRSGCGLTTVVTTKAVRNAFCVLPEAITVSTETEQWNLSACEIAISNIKSKQAIAIGSGVGRGDITPLIKAVLVEKVPVVIDADGLNQLAANPSLLSLLHSNVVVTPHMGEMSRLTELSIEQIKSDPIRVAGGFAKEHSCIVLLKDYQSYISDGVNTALNTSGNSGLAKGGSGDVLCGIVTSLLAQGMSAYDAARAGAFLLGTAADDAMRLLSTRMLIASDVIDAISLL